jgi:soluble lytic murein transglycosylase-like protein
METFYYIAGAILAAVLWLFARAEEKQENKQQLSPEIKGWETPVKRAAQEFGVPFPVSMAIMMVESSGRPAAVGSAGEKGLYQLKEIAIEDLRIQGYGDFSNYAEEPTENIRAGNAYLSLQYKRAGNWPDAIRAYNQGFEGMKRRPELAENYLNKVYEFTEFYS